MAEKKEKKEVKENATEAANLSVVHEGNQIVLPVINGKQMSYDEACEWMQRKKREDEETINVLHQFKCAPLDGALAFHKALAQIYGWTESVSVPSFFGKQPPTTISIAVSATEKKEVVWGRIEIPGITGFLETHMQGETFIIAGQVLKMHAKDIKAIADLTEKLIKEGSIYRGQAIKINFDWKHEGKKYNPFENCPQFIDLRGVSEDDLIFGEKTMNDLNMGLFIPVEYPDACRRDKIPLKRGVLLYGPYGVGKTITAHVTALKAIKSGFTFIYLDSVTDLKEGLKFAAEYAPAIIFAEDIDRAAEGERSIQMDEILNTLDGVDTKGAEIITVLTTNHVEKINPAILRMGRLDVLVEVTPPDAKAAERLVRLYSRGLLSSEANLTKVGKALEGKIPAFIREVTERSKLAAIGRRMGADIQGHVMEADLLAAAKAMEPHAAMLDPKEEPDNHTVLIAMPLKYEDEAAIEKEVKKYAAKQAKAKSA